MSPGTVATASCPFLSDTARYRFPLARGELCSRLDHLGLSCPVVSLRYVQGRDNDTNCHCRPSANMASCGESAERWRCFFLAVNKPPPADQPIASLVSLPVLDDGDQSSPLCLHSGPPHQAHPSQSQPVKRIWTPGCQIKAPSCLRWYLGTIRGVHRHYQPR